MANFSKYSYKLNNKKTNDDIEDIVNNINNAQNSATKQAPLRRKKEHKKAKLGVNIYAYIGILLIIISFIGKPFYFAICAYILGIFVYIKGSHKLGIMTVALSIGSLLIQYFLGRSWF